LLTVACSFAAGIEMRNPNGSECSPTKYRVTSLPTSLNIDFTYYPNIWAATLKVYVSQDGSQEYFLHQFGGGGNELVFNDNVAFDRYTSQNNTFSVNKPVRLKIEAWEYDVLVATYYYYFIHYAPFSNVPNGNRAVFPNSIDNPFQIPSFGIDHSGYNCGPVSAGTYIAQRKRIFYQVNHNVNQHVEIVNDYCVGWSILNSNNQSPWGGTFQTFPGQTILYNFVYDLTTYLPEHLGYYPCIPEEALVVYKIVDNPLLPVITSITSNMIGDPINGYTLFNGQTGFLYSTTQGTNITCRWNYFECNNTTWGNWPFNISNVYSYTPQYNQNFGVTNNGFTGASCIYDNSTPTSKFLRAQLYISNSIGSVLSNEYKIIPQVAFSGGGCPYIFVLGSDTSGGKYFTENNILHHSEFTENINQNITDVYKLKTVPKIDSNKITIQIMETENDVNYFDQIKLYAVDHPVGSKIGITESNDIVMYYVNDVTSTDYASINNNGFNIAPYIQYGQPAPKITGVSNDNVNAHFDSTLQNSKQKSFKNRIKSKGFKSSTDSLALIGEIGSDTRVPINNSNAKDWAGNITIYTKSDSYIKPFSKRVNVSDVIIPFSQTNDNVDHIDINTNSDYAMSYFSVVPVYYDGFIKTELPLTDAVHAINGNILSSLVDIDNNFATMDTTAIIDLKFSSNISPDPSMIRDYVFVVNGRYTSENSLQNSHNLRSSINSNIKPNNVTYNYKLNANYPNPFNPSTKINYELEKSGFTKLEVFDILGRLVQVLVNEYKQAGNYTFEFNGSNLTSGVYIYRLESNGFVSIKRMVLLK